MKAGAFLADARGRLLPASIPMRFFGAAVVYHLLAWIALLPGAESWPGAPSAPGWPLAALHLATLGVLVMTALGAGTQLLPVATRQGVPPPALLAAVWWLYTPAVGVLAAGMATMNLAWLATGALAAVAALLLWCVLVARHLLGARGMAGVITHTGGALVALVVALAAALALVAAWLGHPTLERGTWLTLHRVAAPYGFMGLLALGFAYLLVPMFALGDVPDTRQQTRAAALALAALLAAGAAAWVPAFDALALAAGLGAVGWHLWLMRRTLASGMRRDLGRSFLLVRLGWAGLVASLLLGAVLLAAWPLPRGGAAFGLALIGVWLLSFVLGLLQRIVPFLAAMHGGSGRRNPTPGALTHDGALAVHFFAHLGALALLALAIGFDSAALVRAAAALGAAGALAFAAFFGVVLARRRRAAA
jgi:hypothetical protein